MQFILLDTMVAAGIFCGFDKTPQNVEKAQRWLTVISSLTAKYQKSSVTVPTPVFFEYASRNIAAYNMIKALKNDDKRHSFFQYINHSVASDIWSAAAFYLIQCSTVVNTNNEEQSIKHGVSWHDALIAAYCFKFGHYLITENERDFPHRFFQVEEVTVSPMPNEKSLRKAVYLLSPRIEAWKQYYN